MTRLGRSFPARPQITRLSVISHGYTTAFSDDVFVSDIDIDYIFVSNVISLDDIIVVSEAYENLYGKNFSDTVSADEVLQKATNTHLADTVELTDPISKSTTNTMSDTFSISEIFFGSRARISSDTITPTDTLANVAGYNKSLSDTSTVTDTKSTSRGSTLSDTVTLIQEDVVKYYNGLSTNWTKITKAATTLWTKWRKP